jgi:hypothetical protein
MPRARVHGFVLAALALALVGLGAAGNAASPPPPSPGDPLPRACAFLWSQQAADGGWHSTTYGFMRSGQSLTPFVLHALLAAPPALCPAPGGAVSRALAFLRRHVSEDGQLGVADPDVLEYPNYATAYALRCLVRAGRAEDRPLVLRMRARLEREQYTPEGGFAPESLVYGGWGFGGPRTPRRPGHMDLSHTRKVLQALREAGTDDPALFERAQVFLRLMQRHPSETRAHPAPLVSAESPRRGVRFDGGFFFSPLVLDANKGEILADAQGLFHGSYATASADGALALLAAGVPPSDERVAAARRWIETHDTLEQPEGVPESPQAWSEALDFYHLAVRAEARAALGLAAARETTALRLLSRQQADGRFVNEENHLMKEDDPLLATALAVVALGS